MSNIGILSVLPPLFAIILAIFTRQVILSLAVGIWIGWTFLYSFNPLLGAKGTIDTMLGVFGDTGNTSVIIFSALVGGLISLIQVSGGVDGFVKYVTGKNVVDTPRKAQMLAWILGIVIFIESTIKILIVGTVCRPIFDKMKISREKLSYIADSTSAPICMLIPLNAWGAFVIALLSSQGVDNPVETLISSIAFNFYAIITVIMVLFVVIFDVNIGQMRRAEMRVKLTGELHEKGAKLFLDEEAVLKKPVTDKGSPLNMIVPIGAMTVFMPVALYITGEGNIMKGSGSLAVLWSVLLAILVGGIYYRVKKVLNLSQIMDTVIKGAGGMISLAILMVLAFSLGETCKRLGTGNYIAGLVVEVISPGLIPALVFAASAFVAFSTGTSFGTFALMIPLAVPLSQNSDVNLALSVSAVLGGGVFGDHCSPISDTTIVASMASLCDHIDHVNTQLPYALVSALIALLLYLVAGFLAV